MKKLLIAILTLTTTTLFAQAQTTWLGGTPGKETNWNEPRNWSTNHVPDEGTYVIIKYHNSGHNSQPVIAESVEVGSIEIQAGATLTIDQKGEVVIDGSYGNPEGIVSYGGKLVNEGAIHINNTNVFASQNMTGHGVVYRNGELIHPSYFAQNK